MEINTPLTSTDLPVHVPPYIRARAEQAAELRGLTLNSLIVSAIAEASDEIIDDHGAIRLNEEATRKFWELIDNPKPPNAAMIEAVRSYKRMFPA